MNEQVERIIKHPAAVPAAVGVVSTAVGVTAGYVIGFKRGQRLLAESIIEAQQAREPDEIVTEATQGAGIRLDASDLEQVRARWQDEEVAVGEVVVSERVLPPEEVGRHIGESASEITDEIKEAAATMGIDPAELASNVGRIKAAVESGDVTFEEITAETVGPPQTIEPGSVGEVAEETVAVVTTNVFAGSSDGSWDHDAEVAARGGKEIYIIHTDEFHANEEGFSQMTLTWYAGDDQLAEESLDQDLIHNYQSVIGDDLRFGHGSNDQNVFYVRNTKLETEYMILRHTGSYMQEVMGMDVVSERVPPRTRRMRDISDDET